MSLKEVANEVVYEQPEGGSAEFSDGSDDAVLSEKRGTQFDQKDMSRMGKLPQLRVNVLLSPCC
jgi:hypothetical protein